MDTTLEHLIYGQPTINNNQTNDMATLAVSAGLSAEDGAVLRQRVPLAPIPEPPSLAIAIVAAQQYSMIASDTDAYILAGVRHRDDQQENAVYHYVVLPGDILIGVAGDLKLLLDLIETPAPTAALNVPVEPLPAPEPRSITFQQRTEAIHAMREQLPDGDMRLAFKLLAAALDDRRLVIRQYEGNLMDRLALVCGLMMLLPPSARPLLTFTTYTLRLPPGNREPLIVFSAGNGDTNRHDVNWPAVDLDDTLLEQPYSAHLNKLWNGDVKTFAGHLQEIDTLAAGLIEQQMPVELLNAIAQRHEQDIAVQQGVDLAANRLSDTLHGANPPVGNLRIAYLEQLLQHALTDRDPNVCVTVAREMDADPTIDARLKVTLDETLETQPDAVYVFVRSRLAEDVSEPWLSRLHTAAELSLDVATSDGDPTTIIGWLRLIAREPSTYRLGNVLHHGIMAARTRAHENTELALELLTLAVKRDPSALPLLLEDPGVVGQLSETLAHALHEQRSDAILALAAESRELFLLAVERTIAHHAQAITPAIVRELWALYNNHANISVAPPYRPLNLLQQLTLDDEDILQPGTLNTLLILMLAERADDLFLETARTLAADKRLLNYLVDVLEESARPPDDLLTIIGDMMTAGILTAQEAADTTIEILDEVSWSGDNLLLVDNLARLLNQNADITVTTGTLWKMLDQAKAVRSELMVRAAIRRILANASNIVIEDKLIENLSRLWETTDWHKTARNQLMNWWRSYTQEQSVAQLQKLDRALEGYKDLENIRHVVQTSLAMRRLMGQKTLTEFAQAISTAYNILQDIADGFDPDSRQAISVDLETMRYILKTEMDAEGLMPDARHVLSTNLRELAQLVTTLSDNRSKPSLIRSDDALERGLASGYQAPQSAIDVMKWLAGYLDSIQDEEA